MQSILDKPPANRVLVLNWEKALYITIIILALVTRLWGLGDRVLSHDESIHAKYSWHLYAGQGFSHHPLMHGPFLFHATALSFFLFGDNDFSARVPVALMGVVIVAFPYLFRRWLGRTGALVASFFLLISPSIAYYSRYIRHDIPAMLWALGVIFAMLSYLNDGRKRWLYVMAAAVSLLFATKEVSFIYCTIFSLFLVGLFGLQALNWEWHKEKLKVWFLIALSIMIVGLLAMGLSELSAPLASKEGEPEVAVPLPEEQAAPPLPWIEQAKAFLLIWRSVSRNGGIILAGIGLLATVTILIAGQLQSDTPGAYPSFSTLLMTMIVLCFLTLAVDAALVLFFAQKWQTVPDWLAVLGRTLVWIALLVGEAFTFARYLMGKKLSSNQFLAALLVVVLAAAGVLIRIDAALGVLFAQRWQAASDQLAVLGRTLVWMVLLVGEVFALVHYLMHKRLRSAHLFMALLVVILVAVGVLVRLGLPTLISYTSCRQQVPSPPLEENWRTQVWACGRQALQEFTWPAGGTRILTQIPSTDGILIDTRLVLTVLPFLNGLVAVLIWLFINAFHSRRVFVLIILLGTLCLPFLSPLLMNLAGLKPMDYNPPTVYYTGGLAVEVLLLSVVIGLMWDLRQRMEGERKNTWLIAAAIHYALFVAFFTTFLTNAYGIPSGLVGSLGYWLEQQDVKRGGQPWYYYMIMTAVYEYLPLLLTLIAPVYLAIRGWLVPKLRLESKRLGDFPGINEHFISFVLWWVTLSWIGYSSAGEKMPWLTVHLALPMIVLGAWLVGRLLDEIDWQRLRQSRAWLLALLAPPLVIAMVVLISSISARPFQGYSLTQLQASGRFVNALIGVTACSIGITYLISRTGWRLAARILLFVALLVPVLITIRTAWRFCYITQDDATEFLVYAHGAPGVREALDEIEEISQRYGGGPYAIKVPYGSDGSTLFHWQLRHYAPDYSFGENPSREQLDAPVIIAGSAQWGVVDRYVGDNYIARTYTYIWWPMQDYWNLTWERIQYAITNPDMRSALWDIWYNRDYTRYDEWEHEHGDPGSNHTLDNWPLRGDFRLYIRRDVAEQVWDLPLTTPPEGAEGSIPSDPYAAGWQDLAARLVFGETGSGPGQLQSPRGIKVGPDGFVYVADSKNNRVQKFTLDGEPVATWQRGFIEPWDAAVASDNTIYVADTWSHRIQRLRADGSFISAWGTYGEYTTGGNIGQGAFYGPRGIAIGPSGQVYVADTGNKRIQVFQPDGQFTFLWGGGGALAGYLDEPVGIAIGPNNEVYVADTWNRRIQVFTLSGAYLREWPILGWNAAQSEDRYYLAAEEKPYLAVDGRGYVYVTDPGNFRVLVFDSQGNYVLSFGKYGLDQSSFLLPTGIAVAEDGSIYVSDAHSNRVLVFDPLDLEATTREMETVIPKLKFPAPGAEVRGDELTLLGTGKPDSRVRVLIDGRDAGIAQVDTDGVWTLTVKLVEPGEHAVVLQALAWIPATGFETALTSDPIWLTVRAEGEGAETTAVTAPTLVIEEGTEFPAGEVRLVGSGMPNTKVRVLVDGQVTGTAQVDSEGNWSLDVALKEPGEYQVIVQALNADGEVVAASEPVLLTIIVSPTVDFPTEGAKLPGGQLTLSGTGEPDTDIEILDKGNVIGATQVGADGRWRFA